MSTQRRSACDCHCWQNIGTDVVVVAVLLLVVTVAVIGVAAALGSTILAFVVVSTIIAFVMVGVVCFAVKLALRRFSQAEHEPEHTVVRHRSHVSRQFHFRTERSSLIYMPNFRFGRIPVLNAPSQSGTPTMGSPRIKSQSGASPRQLSPKTSTHLSDKSNPPSPTRSTRGLDFGKKYTMYK